MHVAPPPAPLPTTPADPPADPPATALAGLSPRRRRGRWWSLAVVAVLAVAGAAAWKTWGEAPPPPPRTATVTLGTVQRTATALGTLQPKDYVDVGSQVSGQLMAIHAAIGDRVAAGTLLAELDPVVYETRVRADRAALADLDAQIAQARAEMTLSRVRLRRSETLGKSGTVSADALDAARAEAAIAEARVASLLAQRDKAESTLEGDLASLGYTRIIAPMAGTVVDLQARVGQTLNAVQTTPVILRLADLATMTVEAQVAESDIGRIRPGMAVYFTTLGQPERRWTSTVRQVLPTPQILNDVVLYTALIDVDNADGALLPSMSAQVFFILGEARDVPVVPLAALGPAGKDGRRTASVLGPQGPETRTVVLGVSTRSEAEVVSGLAPGETVLLPEARATPAAARRDQAGMPPGPPPGPPMGLGPR